MRNRIMSMRTVVFFFFLVSILAVVGLTGTAFARSGSADSFYAVTDRTSYTGTLTKYNSLADAESGSNALGTYTIPGRDTSAPYNTPYRDLGIYSVKNAPNFDATYPNTNQFLTAWYYTTDQNNGQYSGYGNPNNTNTGFIQIWDGTSSTVTSSSGSFTHLQGTYYDQFRLQVTGTNASAGEYARLWPAPLVGGAASLSKGTFLSYSYDITFGGLEGQLGADGWITSTNDPTSATGTFNAIFQNTNTTDTTYDGFYVVNLTIGLDNWASGQGQSLKGSFATSEFGAPVPLPTTMLLLGPGLAGLAAVRRRLKS